MTKIPHQHDISDLNISELIINLKLIDGHIERYDEKVYWVTNGGCPFCHL